MISNTLDIKFSQENFHTFLQNQKKSEFKSKIVNVSNQHSVINGYCFGLSNAWLLSLAKNEKKQFIDLLTNIPNNILKNDQVLEKKIFVEDAKKKSEFEKLSNFIIKSQTFNINEPFINELKKTIKLITDNKNTHDKITFEDHLRTIMNILIEKTMHDKNYSLDERKIHRNTITHIYLSAYELYRCATQPIKAKGIAKLLRRKPIDKLINKDHYFSTIVKDIQGNCNLKDGEFTNKDIGKILIHACEYQNTSNYQNWLEINKIFSEYYNRDTNSVPQAKAMMWLRMDLSNFLKNKLISEKDQYFLFFSPIHTFALSIIKNTIGKYEYTFFDPNTGVKILNKKSDFDLFIKNYVSENENKYHFIKNDSGSDYTIKFLDMGTPNIDLMNSSRL